MAVIGSFPQSELPNPQFVPNNIIARIAGPGSREQQLDLRRLEHLLASGRAVQAHDLFAGLLESRPEVDDLVYQWRGSIAYLNSVRTHAALRC